MVASRFLGQPALAVKPCPRSVRSVGLRLRCRACFHPNSRAALGVWQRITRPAGEGCDISGYFLGRSRPSSSVSLAITLVTASSVCLAASAAAGLFQNRAIRSAELLGLGFSGVCMIAD
jgi:hypothetical protein